MNVKSRLQLCAALPILMAVITAIILYRISAEVERVVPRLRTTHSITREATRLDQATFLYLLTPGEATRNEWLESHQGLNQLLQEQPALTARDRGMLADIRTRHETMTGLFRSMADQAETGTGIPSADTQDTLRLILNHTRNTIMDAQTLAANAHDAAVTLQQRAYLLIIVVATVMAAILSSISLLLIGRVTSGVQGLQEGMNKVAGNDLGQRLPAEGRDEISNLNRGFNHMAAEIASARQKLQDEISEKARVAESLRASNVELSAALEKLQRAQQEALSRERADALRQITRGIVHDINDALMPVKGLSDFYMQYPDQLQNVADIKEAFATVHSAADRISRTVRNIGSFCLPSRQAGKTNASPADIVKEVVSTMEPLWKAQKQAEGVAITVKTELGPVPAFAVERADLVDAIRALLTNAIDAMPGGGAVTIRTRLDAGHAVIEVNDTGEGMDASTAGRACEPFFSTKGEGHAGLGLVTVQAVVTRAAGTFALRSTPGKGTTAVVTLPVTMEPPADVTHAPAMPLTRRLHVLTIDDEPWNARVLAHHLTVDGHKTESRSTGREALDFLRTQSVDLVILDRAMPDISGDLLATQIRQLHPETPILMLTGFGGLMASEGTLPMGVTRVLSKPIDLQELREAISFAVAG